MNYQTLTCPNCNGSGCSTCQNTGKVRVSSDQLQQLKTMTQNLPPATNPFGAPVSPTGGNAPKSSNSLQNLPGEYRDNPYQGLKKIKNNANLAGIITFSILATIAGGAAASWYFLKSLKPFFSTFISLFISIFSYLAWHHPTFSKQQPNDFLSASRLQS